MAFRSLVSAVSEQRQEIRQTLSSISYFNVWDANAVAECCRLSSLAEFSPGEIILGSETGNSHTVYFILDGVCRMIQYLQVETKMDSRGEMKFNLYKSVGETLNGELDCMGYASLLFNKKHEFQREETIEQDVKSKQADTQRNELTKETEQKDKFSFTDTIDSALKDSVLSDVQVNIQETENSNQEAKTHLAYKDDHHVRVLQECRKKLKGIIWVNKKDAAHERPTNVNGYFIQTGFLFKGACFGLSKNMDKNYIMSETVVKCLKIPQRFLLQHNPCNIWNRILLFNSLYQPTQEKIMECFQTDRKWTDGKKKLAENIISKKKIPNYTKFSDVPYSIRLTDARLCDSHKT